MRRNGFLAGKGQLVTVSLKDETEIIGLPLVGPKGGPKSANPNKPSLVKWTAKALLVGHASPSLASFPIPFFIIIPIPSAFTKPTSSTPPSLV
ncbi:hypothetical protein RJT34_25547 [Clitoria ternatea]|uniref:Uncharacterized protein n=1 Tax=Clitoria ternatea TaxID=43366 RepID=A0AAN9FWR8_CLITE